MNSNRCEEMYQNTIYIHTYIHTQIYFRLVLLGWWANKLKTEIGLTSSRKEIDALKHTRTDDKGDVEMRWDVKTRNMHGMVWIV